MSRHIPFGATVVSGAEMHAAERQAMAAGVSADELMERAGLAVAREVWRFAAGRPILVAAGPGNNGGDAYAAARHLAVWGSQVAVATLGTPRDGPAARMAARWAGPSEPIGQALLRPVFVDGLFGAGGMRPLDAGLARHVAALNGDADLSIAIDLPSGVDPDGVAGNDGLRATVTVALGALKRGQVVGPGAKDCGHLVVADIGIAASGAVRTIRPRAIEPPDARAQKYSRGMVLVVSGAMAGAGLLSATAAMHSGAGYVVLAASNPTGAAPHALVRRSADTVEDLDPLLGDERVGAVVIGPGLGRGSTAEATLARVLASPRDLLIDADALTLLGREGVGRKEVRRIGAERRRVVLTPHSGEFDRLFGTGGGCKIDRTAAAARRTGATIVHKGADTVIAGPDGEVIVCANGSPWLSTAGTGDVLAGIVAARLTRHREHPATAAEEGVWWHAAAAARAVPPFAADDLVRHLPAAMPTAEAR